MNHLSQAQEASSVARSSSPDSSASLPLSPSSSSSTLTLSQHPRETDSRASKPSLPTQQLLIHPAGLSQHRQDCEAAALCVDIEPRWEIGWPSPDTNGFLIEPVGRVEHDQLVTRVRGQAKRTAQLNRESRRQIVQWQMARRQRRRELQALKGDLNHLGDSFQNMQSWAHAMNSALQPLFLERLEQAGEGECEDIEEILKMADGGYPGA